jgi:hypothetical protein
MVDASRGHAAHAWSAGAGALSCYRILFPGVHTVAACLFMIVVILFFFHLKSGDG